MPIRARHLALPALLTWSAVLALLMLVPVGDGLPSGGAWDWADKPLHAAVFAIHCGLVWLSLPSAMPRRRAAVVALLAAGLYALLLEALQIPIPSRDWEWLDVACDFAGAGLVALLAASSRATLRRTS